MFFQKLLHPSKWVLIFVPPLSFAALIFIFATQATRSVSAYMIYCMSAYSLTIWLAALPRLIKKRKTAIMTSRIMRKVSRSKITGRYLNDLAFRGSVSIYQGVAVNVFYVVFRIVAGIRYASVWFISMAVYYLVLGCLRAYLIVCYRRRDPELEHRCYHTTAWLLFLLNVPMGGMIVLMVRTNSGFSYPGYIIYLSALYTFYTMVTSIQKSIIGSGGYMPEDVQDVQEIMASGKWDLEHIITHEFPLNELEQGIRTAGYVDHAGNVVVKMKANN